MTDVTVTVRLDGDDEALLKDIEARTGMSREAIVSLLVQRGIEDGIDSMLLDRPSLGLLRPY